VVRQGIPVTGSDTSSELLERARELSLLGDFLEAVRRSSRGRVALVSGEAGVGKTALLRRFCDEHRRSARVLWGRCEPLFTPPALGPFLEIADITGGDLADLVETGARPHEVAAALTGELRTRAPTIVVLEDLHSADEATLDVLTLLARRVAGVPALVAASYRDDALDRAHPLRVVLGELATGEAIGRLKLVPLSPAAVAKLAEPHGVDPQELYRRTAGNPFFVTEALAAGAGEIPQTVRDAVLARAARLRPGARTLLEAVAVTPPHAELWLLETLAREVLDHLDECVASGMLTAEPAGVAFRHELARLAVEESVAPKRRIELHEAALAALATPPTGPSDVARLAHHAEAARDTDAVLRFAPAAAARAASLGAHREAAAQYARALRFAGEAPLEAQADLLERLAYECYLTGQFTEAIEAQERAVEYRRGLGDARKEGDSLRSLSRLLRFVGRTEEAAAVAQEAIAVLERLPPGHELGMAYSNVSHICAAAEDAGGAIDWGTRALELAERLDDTEVLVYALTNIGAMEFLAAKGVDTLERSLDLGRRAGLEEPVGRAFLNLVWWPLLRARRLDIASRYLDEGLEYCNERGLDLWRLFFLACRARLDLDRGNWVDAGDDAAFVLRDPRTWPVPRILTLTVVALVRARRGDPDVWAPLDEALALAEPTGELQRIAPVAAARAESLWLEGRNEVVGEVTATALELAVRRRSSWVIGELACWRWRAGIGEEVPAGAAEPYGLEIAGEWARAAELWSEMGGPYEAALALGEADDEDALRRSLDELQRLGARPAAAIIARRLRERGARGLPRGPRPATRQNPANLTPRELEVLALVAQGLRNADIAERLVVAEKTVDHHVSAILRKLGVETRGQASAEAVRLGLAGQDR
jgi:DNA-binding CsgD family transcriptional regulator